MSSPAMSSPVQGASSRGSPARAVPSSSPGVVNPTDSPPVPGTPHSARSAPRTPASGIVAPTPGSAAPSAAGGRRSASLQPSPNRSDLGRGSSQVRAAAGSQGEEAGSGSGNPNTMIWGTDIQVSETKAAARKFFTEFVAEGEEESKYMKLLEQAYMRGAGFINLDCGHVRSFDIDLYEKLVRFPTEAITILDVVLTELYSETYQYRSDFMEVQIVSRPFNLLDTAVMRDLNPSDVDKLVSIKGMIIRSSAIVPDIQRAYFECATCKGAEEVDIVNGRIAEPTKCKNGQCAGAMDLKHNRCLFKDKQMVRLQESPEDIPQGETPMTVNLCAFEDLVDVAKPGDRMEVTGIYRAQAMRVKATQKTLKSVYRTYIDVIHFKRTEKGRMGEAVAENEMGDDSSLMKDREKAAERALQLSKDPNIYQKLVDSFAPSIYEMDDVKKGLLCQLFGGRNSGGSGGDGSGSGRFRGDLNVLLVGDPGVSKSQLLQYVHKIAPRGIYTSGKGSSAVGLTAYVTKDPETKDIVLESGALVLSDKGICCIDEFDKMSESTRAILHEAMEQQTISVAKAGIICSLNSRTSILAAANPINSRYNPQMSVVENMNLPPTLLSRFDLIYLMLDQPNPQSDERLAKHIVSLYYEHPPRASSTVLAIEEFAEYVSFAREHCHPVLNDDAKGALIEGYVNMRRMSTSKNTISATPRQLESIVRLAEAHAKMRLSQTVEVIDVEEAMRLLRVATQSAATDPRTGKIDMDLINTGRSASSRIRTAHLVQLLKTKLDSGSISFSNLLDLVQQEQAEITTQELQAAIRQLSDDDVVVTSGTGYNITIARTGRA